MSYVVTVQSKTTMIRLGALPQYAKITHRHPDTQPWDKQNR